MRRTFSALALLLLAPFVLQAQETPSVTVGTGRNELRINIDITSVIPATEVVKLKQIGTYEVSEVVSADTLAASVAAEVVRINAITDDAVKKTELTKLSTSLRSPAPNIVDSASTPDCKTTPDCSRITISLTSLIDYDKTYVLKLAGVMLGGSPVKPVEFKIEKSAAIVEALNASNTRKEVRIQATGPLVAPAPPGTLSLQRKTLRISANGTKVVDHIDTIPATVTLSSTSQNLVEVKLDKKLNEAQSHTLSTPAGTLTDGTGVPIAAKGTIKIPGRASPPDDPELSLEVMTNAAVDQKPQFDLDIAWAPSEGYRIKKSLWFWRPEAKIDVGLGDTKSDNAITLALLAQHSFDTSNLREPEDNESVLRDAEGRPIRGRSEPKQDDVQLKTNRNWRLTPWYQLGSYDFFIGPKLEADRVFRRINVLGHARFEFRFHRWVATIDHKRKLLPELGDLADLVEINRGYRFIPYVSFDFGGHVKNETVENSDKMVSVSVPRHGIFRSNLGLKALLQWRMLSLPMTLTLDERLFHLASSEEIAFVTDEGVGIRRLRGFHHHGEVAWDVALDPAKHYNFTVKYENGRTAPNFEYLNKVSSGFKVIF
jgi:hypothetical protein